MRKQNKLQIIVINPPSKKESEEMIKHISEIIKMKYYL